ncbi:MAG: ATP-binding protein [Fibrobacterota bacterium]|nr:ATP-binding protein [Fibrobacterota bacterium]
MESAPIPSNETARLRALHEFAILDTEPEILYDDIAKLASQICDTPICLVSLIDKDRQWFKSKQGLSASQTPREYAFCAHAILGVELFEIEDSTKDIRFRDNPLVTGAPNVVFYAGVPLELGDGINVGTLCVIDTKPRRLTDKQRNALRCLANQVVSNLRLRKANEDLQGALKVKSTFLATMSHEIRTPLTGIIGISNLLIDSAVDSKSREQLNIISSCSHDLLAILNDILDYSKIESGNIRFENHPFSLRSLIGNVHSILTPLADLKGLGLRFDFGNAPDWIAGDSLRLSQILFNLIGNAIKFTAVGEVALSMKSHPTPGGKIALVFSVRDEGIGIPKEALATIFEPFSQVDSSTTRKYGGTGLGLAIVRHLVDAMDGQLTVDSEDGKGSTFTFTLEFQLAVAPATIAPPGLASADSGSARLAETRPMTILLAEDNEVNQFITLELLKRLGYNADIAWDGLEALKMLETKDYDMVLMDCQMPVMDGLEVMAHIKKNIPPEGRPIVYALTAAGLDDVRGKCLSAGMRAVLQKPISQESLRQALLDCPLRKPKGGVRDGDIL